MYTHEQYIKMIKAINPNLKILSKYSKMQNRVKAKCTICEKVWEPLAYSLKEGKGCPHCSAVKGAMNHKGKTSTKTHEQFAADLNRINPSVLIKSEYVNTHTDIKCYCKRCKHEWSAKPYSLLQNHGCPRCVKSGTSFMEQFILQSFQAVLGKSRVLSRDKKAIGKELDVYIPELKLAVEPGNWYLHAKRIDNDKEKLKLCKNKNIKLLFVYDNVPENCYIPFKHDYCFTYKDDLNSGNRDLIIELVEKLFRLAGLNVKKGQVDWKAIEKGAYLCSKSMTHKDFVNRLTVVHPNIDCLGEYKNSGVRIQVRCKKCGRVWNAVPSGLLSGDGCWNCARKEIGKGQRVPFDQFLSKVHDNFPNIDIDPSSYFGTHSQVKVTCKRCQRTWNALARTLIRNKPIGCKVCEAENRRQNREKMYLLKLSKEKPHITCLDPYINRETKIKHKCKVCGHIWKSTPACVLSSKYGCPNWKAHKKFEI